MKPNLDYCMSKLERLKLNLVEILNKAKDPVLCWSGGKDSNFLLQVTKELGYNLPVLVFPHLWSEHQKEFIKKMVEKLKLTAFFYTPNRINFDPPYVGSFYNFQNVEIPVISDHIDDPTRCGIDVGLQINFNSPRPRYHWDKTLVGSKKSDTHPLIDLLDFQHLKVETPLWDWTDEEVLEITQELDYYFDERVYLHNDETADTGNFVACMKCVGTEEVFCPKEQRNIRGVYAKYTE